MPDVGGLLGELEALGEFVPFVAVARSLADFSA